MGGGQCGNHVEEGALRDSGRELTEEDGEEPVEQSESATVTPNEQARRGRHILDVLSDSYRIRR